MANVLFTTVYFDVGLLRGYTLDGMTQCFKQNGIYTKHNYAYPENVVWAVPGAAFIIAGTGSGGGYLNLYDLDGYSIPMTGTTTRYRYLHRTGATVSYDATGIYINTYITGSNNIRIIKLDMTGAFQWEYDTELSRYSYGPWVVDQGTHLGIAFSSSDIYRRINKSTGVFIDETILDAPIYSTNASGFIPVAGNPKKAFTAQWGNNPITLIDVSSDTVVRTSPGTDTGPNFEAIRGSHVAYSGGFYYWCAGQSIDGTYDISDTDKSTIFKWDGVEGSPVIEVPLVGRPRLTDTNQAYGSANPAIVGTKAYTCERWRNTANHIGDHDTLYEIEMTTGQITEKFVFPNNDATGIDGQSVTIVDIPVYEIVGNVSGNLTETELTIMNAADGKPINTVTSTGGTFLINTLTGTEKLITARNTTGDAWPLVAVTPTEI